MSTPYQRSSNKERFWRRMLRQFRRSGLSVQKFCEQQGLSVPSFYGWRRTLAARDEAAVGFVPVQVTPPPQPLTTDGSAAAMELVLGAGRRLRIGPGFDGPTLMRLLALLEEGRP
jgi:transposase